MIRSILSLRGPILMSVFPFNIKSNEQYDRPVNKLIKPLVEDEMGWDRVKRIFMLNEYGQFTKELQSIINVTLAGAILGTVIGGLSESKNTVNNFISTNEATRFINHFEAKRQLQRKVFLSFMKKGLIMGRKLGSFCLFFSTLTTCITVYRGKLAIENYIFGGSITGLLNRINLGLRGSLVGAGVGGTLGGICGTASIILLYLTGTTMDEMIQVQHDWVSSRTEVQEEKIKTYMAERGDFEEKKIFEEIQKMRLLEQEHQESKKKVENPST